MAEKDIELHLGMMIRSFNNVEMILSNMIFDYFKPNANDSTFRNVLLHNSIISFGQKIKLISNFIDFDSKIIEKLKKYSALRNAFAHGQHVFSLSVKKNTDGFQEVEEVNVTLKVMNSQGKVRDKKFVEIAKEFYILHNDVFNYINDYSKKL